jgi:hypothetical protein
MHPIPYSTDASDRHSWAFYAKEMPKTEGFTAVIEELIRPRLSGNPRISGWWLYAQWLDFTKLATEWLDEVCELGKGAYRVTCKPGNLVNENVGVPGSGSIALPLRCLATPALYRPLPVVETLDVWYAPWGEEFRATDSFQAGPLPPSRAAFAFVQPEVKTEGSPKTPESEVAYLCDDPMCVHCGKNPKVKPTPRKSRIRDLVNETWKRERCMSCEEYRLCEPQTGLCMLCVSGLAEEHS